MRRGVPFTYLKVDEDAAADAWIRRLNDGGWRTPTILIGDPDRPDMILREPSDGSCWPRWASPDAVGCAA